MGARTAAARPTRWLLATLARTALPALLAVALLLPQAGPLAPAGTSAPGLVPAAAALPSATYTTFTLNICHCLGVKKARADLRRALTLGDAGGLQEMSDAEDRQMLIEVLTANDWGWYMPNGAGVAIPVIWDRSRFRLIEGRSTQVHGPEKGVTPARYINAVRLREVTTGKVFGFINTHTIAQASRDARLTDMHRIPRLRKHLQMLRVEIKRLFATTEHVFVSGDLNVNYLADRRRRNPGLPTDALGDLVTFDMPLTGSRGPTSLLDYGMTLRHGSGYLRTAAQVVRGFHSDHDAVVFSYRTTDLFATGPVHNLPTGAGPERTRVGDRMARAVMNAEPGELVRLATARLDEPALAQALVDAAAEGVAVQVVLGPGRATATEERVAAALGSDRAAASWLVRCADSCLGGSGRMETNVLLVSRAGGTTELTMVPSAPAVTETRSRWQHLFVSSDAALYGGYGQVFERLAADTADAASDRVLRWGSYIAQLYPVAADDPRDDPVLKGLAAVGCKNARGLRTDDGRTNVRVAVQAWAGDRGKRIAERLALLKSRGCDVAAVLGPKVLSGIRKILSRAGIPARDAAVAQNLLVVDGRFGKSADRQKAWTGGPAWTDSALGSDGVSLVVSSADSVKQYLDGFSRAWAQG